MGRPSALVIGGSLGGLFAANLLRTIGWDAVVFERASGDLASRGTGLGTRVELFAVMRRIGIRGDGAIGVEVRSRVCLGASGNVICEIPVRQITTAWDRIYHALRNALPSELYNPGMQLERFEPDARKITAVFTDGTRIEGDLIIGADGIHSAVRRQLMPDLKPSYAGYVAWRGVAQEDDVPEEFRLAVFEHMNFCFPDGELALTVPMTPPFDAARASPRRCQFSWFRPVGDGEKLAQLCTDASGRRHGVSIPPPLIRPELLAALRVRSKAILAPQVAVLIERAEQTIMQPIFDLESPQLVFGRALLAGIKSKQRVHPDGTQFGHQRFSHGALYLLLQNRTYRGEATHKGNSYPGEHAAIVDKQLWDAVQAALAENRVARTTGARTKQPSLLTGILFDDAGGRLTPTYCIKKGTRYRYYVSTTLVTGATNSRSTRRIPAGDLETVVLNRLRAFLANRAEILDAIEDEADGSGSKRHLFKRGQQLADDLGAQASEKIKSIVTALVRRVEIRPDCLQIDISRSRLAAWLTASIDPPLRDDKPSGSRNDILTLTVAAKLARVGREMKMLIDSHNDQAAADPSLLRIVARAHDIQSQLIQDPKRSVHDIARQERVTAAYIYTLLRLPWLAPDITAAIVNGQQPPQLNAMKLMRLTARLPSDWAEQRALLGFR